MIPQEFILESIAKGSIEFLDRLDESVPTNITIKQMLALQEMPIKTCLCSNLLLIFI